MALKQKENIWRSQVEQKKVAAFKEKNLKKKKISWNKKRNLKWKKILFSSPFSNRNQSFPLISEQLLLYYPTSKFISENLIFVFKQQMKQK